MLRFQELQPAVPQAVAAIARLMPIVVVAANAAFRARVCLRAFAVTLIVQPPEVLVVPQAAAVVRALAPVVVPVLAAALVPVAVLVVVRVLALVPVVVLVAAVAQAAVAAAETLVLAVTHACWLPAVCHMWG